MRNCKGFTLIEVVTSLMILTLAMLILLPGLVLIYNERISVQQEQTALLLLDQVITEWVYESKDFFDDKIKKGITTYTFSFNTKMERTFTACISWEGVNGQEYERCESGKK